ncbi:hypothetical protein scyTo_0007251 [Scyliorhinus torazame]|uniref:High mobility group protein HMGI-C n=1 Tax=Scyliorhinus torazame TaxID=75743 RepID=A0A401NNS6_SCYTO|nr:hypothetical protein [Scyliorhinus torazame]
MSTSGAGEGAARQGAAAPKQPAPAQPVRRGRGRPKKQPQEPVGPPTPKRPRGRPIGSKNKEPRAVQKKAEPPRVKRPRGRPRKWVSNRMKMISPWLRTFILRSVTGRAMTQQFLIRQYRAPSISLTSAPAIIRK